MDRKITTYADYIRGEKEIAIPSYRCKSCHNCSNNWCSVFNRHVIPDYNKCFYHSLYHTTTSVYTTPDEIRELSKVEDLVA